jgi:hypothetical protein
MVAFDATTQSIKVNDILSGFDGVRQFGRANQNGSKVEHWRQPPRVRPGDGSLDQFSTWPLLWNSNCSGVLVWWMTK